MIFCLVDKNIQVSKIGTDIFVVYFHLTDTLVESLMRKCQLKLLLFFILSKLLLLNRIKTISDTIKAEIGLFFVKMIYGIFSYYDFFFSLCFKAIVIHALYVLLFAH